VPDDRLIAIRAAAIVLGVSTSLLYQLVKKRSLPHYRVAGKILFAPADLDDFMRKCRVEAIVSAPTAVPRPAVTLKHVSLGRSKRPATARGAGNV
jgi:excisionase family DNA binding protein